MQIPNRSVLNRVQLRGSLWAYAALVGCCSVSCILAADAAKTSNKSNPSNPLQNIPESISFDYLSDSKSYSINSAHLPFTVAVSTIPGGDANVTRVTVSVAFPLEGFDAASVRVKAKTTQDRVIEPTKSQTTTVAEKGSPWPTSTFDVEFAAAPDKLSRLIIESRRKLEDPSKIQSSYVKSLELVTSQKEDEQYTRWGNVSDLDGDCEFDINEKTLRMVVPPGCHDLAPGQPLNAPFILNQISGDFIVQVKVVGKFVPGKLPQKRDVSYNGAGFLVWDNDNHYLRVERNAYWSRGDGLLRCDAPLMEYWKDRQYQGHNLDEDKVIADFTRGDALWLRLARSSKEMTVSISHDGTEWEVTKSFETDLPDELFLGLASLNTSHEPFVVKFEQFSLVTDRLIAPARLTQDKSEKNP